MATLTTSFQKLGEVLIGTGTYGKFYLRLYGKYVSQNISGNSTQVQYQLRHYTETGYITYYSSSQTLTGDISTSVSNSQNQKFGAGETTLVTTTKNITHTADGTKTISVGATFKNSYFNNTVTIKATSATLPTIPRATKPTLVNDSYVLGENIVISLPRVNNNFTHNLLYKVGDSPFTMFASDVGTSFTWDYQNIDVVNWILDNDEAKVDIYCETWNGENYIGEEVISFKGIVPDHIVPIIDSVTITEAVDGIASKIGSYVKNKSKLNVVVEASGQYSSTIKTYKTTIDGVNYINSSFTSDALTTSGTLTVTTTVTDSRGRSNTETTDINVLDYYAPKIIGFGVDRCTSDGTLADNDTAEYLKFYLNYDIAPLSNKNDKKVAFEYNNNGSWVELKSYTNSYKNTINYVTTTQFSVDKSYVCRVVITDFFANGENASSSLKEVTATYTLINFHNSGKALAFGKVSEIENAMEVELDMYYKDTLLENKFNVSGKVSKNLFDKKTIVSSDVAGKQNDIRLSSRQDIWLEVGTYAFSTNLSTSYQFAVTVNDVSVPPTNDYPNYIYDSTWQAVGSTQKIFTINKSGWFALQLRKADNGNLTPSDIASFDYQLEKGAIATEHEEYYEPILSVLDSNSYLHEVPYVLSKVSKNLFNKNDITNGRSYADDGTHVELSNAFIQESYIPVESSTNYIFSTASDLTDVTNGRTVIMEYDSSYNFVKRNLVTYSGTLIITTTSETKYVRLCASSIGLDTYQFEKGNVRTSYEKYIDPILSIRDSNGELQKVNYSQKIGNLSNLKTTNKENLVGAVNELADIHYMAIGLSANTNVTISTAWSYPKLALDTVKRYVGTGKLIHSNNTIVIGKGVKYVRVSATLMTRGIANTALVLNLKHNSTYIGAGYFYPATVNNWGTITTVPMIVGVKEGDTFQLDAGAGATGTMIVAGGNYTLLSIEVVG